MPLPDNAAARPMPILAGLALASVEFKLTPGYQMPPASAPAPVNLAMDFATICHRIGERERAVVVEVTIRPNTDAIVPYTGKIAAVATIQGLPVELGAEAADEEAMNYGATVAFSTIRDEFLRLTGMTTFNRLLLPLVPRTALLAATTFYDEKGNVLRQLKPAEPATA